MSLVYISAFLGHCNTCCTTVAVCVLSVCSLNGCELLRAAGPEKGERAEEMCGGAGRVWLNSHGVARVGANLSSRDCKHFERLSGFLVFSHLCFRFPQLAANVAIPGGKPL